MSILYQEYSTDFSGPDRLLDGSIDQEWTRCTRGTGFGYEALNVVNQQLDTDLISGAVKTSLLLLELPADQYSQMTIVSWMAQAGPYPGVSLICCSDLESPDTDTIASGYYAWFDAPPAVGGIGNLILYKTDNPNGVLNQELYNAPITIAALPAVIRLEIEGPNITILVDDVIVATMQDSDNRMEYPYTGIMYGGGGTLPTGICDDYSAGRIEGVPLLTDVNGGVDVRVGDDILINGVNLSGATAVSVGAIAGDQTDLPILSQQKDSISVAAFEINQTSASYGLVRLSVSHPELDVFIDYVQAPSLANQVVTGVGVDAVNGLAQQGGVDGDQWEIPLLTPTGEAITASPDTNLIISPAAPNATTVDYWRFTFADGLWDTGAFTLEQAAAVAAYWSSTFTLPPAIIGNNYDFDTAPAASGDAPLSFAVATGATPDLISYQSTGEFVFYPLLPGDSALTLLVTNAQNPGGAETGTLLISVAEATLSGPEHQNVTGTTAQIRVTTDSDRSDLFWICDTSAQQPTPAQIRLGQNAAGLTALVSGNFLVTAYAPILTPQDWQTINGLSIGNIYNYWFVQATNDHTGNHVLGGTFNTIVGAQFVETFALPSGVVGAPYYYDTAQHAEGNNPLTFTSTQIPPSFTYENGILQTNRAAEVWDEDIQFTVSNAENPAGDTTAQIRLLIGDAAGVFVRMFQHLLPRSPAWALPIGSAIRDFFTGLAGALVGARQYMDLIHLDLFSETTRQRGDWSDQFALLNSDVTEAEDRARIDWAWKSLGGQGLDYLQDILRGSGFDVYVHNSWVPGTEPPPGEHGAPNWRVPAAWLQPPAYMLVNKLSYTVTNWEVTCGDSDATCGNPGALAGRFGGFLEEDKVYTTNPPEEYWPYVTYIGGETFGDLATIPPRRKDDFELLCLKLFPANQWLGILVEYTE